MISISKDLFQAILDVLWFYADDDNYQGIIDPDYQWTGTSKEYPSNIEGDSGERARLLLEELSRVAIGDN